MRYKLLAIAVLNIVLCVQSQRAKKVFAHYLPWYDGTGVNFPLRTGWCYTYSAFIDCSDQIIMHYMNKPLIGEYSQFDASVIEYHLLLFVASGIDGLIININAGNPMQTSASLFILDQIVAFEAKYSTVSFKIMVSYDDGGGKSDSDIDTYMEWVYNNIYNNPAYASLIFKDDVLDVPVLVIWSESNESYYYTKVRELFSNNVFVVIRNARLFDDSDGNFEWVS